MSQSKFTTGGPPGGNTPEMNLGGFRNNRQPFSKSINSQFSEFKFGKFGKDSLVSPQAPRTSQGKIDTNILGIPNTVKNQISGLDRFNPRSQHHSIGKIFGDKPNKSVMQNISQTIQPNEQEPIANQTSIMKKVINHKNGKLTNRPFSGLRGGLLQSSTGAITSLKQTYVPPNALNLDSGAPI